MVVGVDFAGERMLGRIWRKQFRGGIGCVARLLLEKRKDSVGGATSNGRWKKGVDDGC